MISTKYSNKLIRRVIREGTNRGVQGLNTSWPGYHIITTSKESEKSLIELEIKYVDANEFIERRLRI